MKTFELTNRAKFDLKPIAAYTQRKWGREQRRVYLRQFDDAFHLLAETPDIGHSCDYIRLGYRKFPVTSHIVFYRAISEAKIEVVRILHKKMDAKPHISEP
ncbi:type II toxin-antitoxin system RelE/ParE family toxin [Teredinibacter turnerae]|uniref:type II toxin-antitoxin system RelE/ParE family toxin n=1 Tax=Teredinibacter turnerae TaxID=2426 RepID=UPI0005F79FFA|nr:type II toxin-antitoxin system RelE/ParE family toxin [Teredinibacter turnerae]